MSGIVQAATLATALGSGLVSGVWFTFSAFVMPALDRLPAAQGAAAMQSINRLAVTAPLMVAMFGTALACLGLGVWAVVSLDGAAAWWVLGGGAVYVLGTIVVTRAGNVPLNNALEQLPPDSQAATELWARYVRDWTAWNHVRLASSLGAAALLTIALTVA